MSTEAMKLAAEFNRYFTSANGAGVRAKVSVTRDEWRVLFNAIQQAEAQQPATGEPVYQIRKAFTQDAEWAWRDATEEAFHMHPKEHRRILYTHAAPSVPDEKPLPDLMMASYHEAIGWNACRAAMLAAKDA